MSEVVYSVWEKKNHPLNKPWQDSLEHLLHGRRKHYKKGLYLKNQAVLPRHPVSKEKICNIQT